MGESKSAAKTALITGAASGFGYAVAKSLLSDGWNIVGVDWNEEASVEAMKKLEGLTIYQADVSDYPDIAAAFVRTWKTYGRLDFVFSNAGVVSRGSFYEEQAESQQTMDGLPIPPRPADALRSTGVNLDGAVQVAYLALHYMRKSPEVGSLIFTSSSAALIPPSAVPVYGGSKAGVVHFSRCIAGPYKKRGIRVNCLCPGFSHTNIAGPGFFEAFPQEHLLPVELYVKHVRDLISDEKACGKVIEISGKEHFLHETPEPSNDSMRAILKIVDSDTF